MNKYKDMTREEKIKFNDDMFRFPVAAIFEDYPAYPSQWSEIYKEWKNRKITIGRYYPTLEDAAKSIVKDKSVNGWETLRPMRKKNGRYCRYKKGGIKND